MLTTVDSIIEALGGSAAAAAIVGVGVSAVSNWKTRGSIPSDKFMIVERALADRGRGKPSPDLFGFEMPAEATSS